MFHQEIETHKSKMILLQFNDIYNPGIQWRACRLVKNVWPGRRPQRENLITTSIPDITPPLRRDCLSLIFELL